jgi:hypothetical protein
MRTLEELEDDDETDSNSDSIPDAQSSQLVSCDGANVRVLHCSWPY